MRKIPTLFLRDPATNRRHVSDEVHPDCRWVLDGEGVATYRWDGTAVRVDDGGVLWRRREVGAAGSPPAGFEQEGPTDADTGKRIGWVPCDRSDRGDRWHWQAFDAALEAGPLPPGTYELVGPKVQGNPHRLEQHQLVRHGERMVDAPRSFDALRRWLTSEANDDGFEGVVWHHPDGRRAKLKARDFPR